MDTSKEIVRMPLSKLLYRHNVGFNGHIKQNGKPLCCCNNPVVPTKLYGTSCSECYDLASLILRGAKINNDGEHAIIEHHPSLRKLK